MVLKSCISWFQDHSIKDLYLWVLVYTLGLAGVVPTRANVCFPTP